MDLIQQFNKEQATRPMPKFKTGDTVRVHQKITEGGKERVQAFEGVIIKIRGGYGQNGSFTVRKTSNGIGVEKVYPFMMPAIEKIELIKRGKTRKSKLYYLRDKQPKEARLKEVPLTKEEKEALSFDMAPIRKAEAEKKKAEEEKAKAEAEAKEKAEAEKAEKEAKKEEAKSEEPKEEEKKEEPAKTEEKEGKKSE